MRRSTTVAFAALAIVLGLLAAGCLSGTETTASPETVVGSVPEATTPAVTGDATAGKAVFASQGCGGCHTLSAAGASGHVGPNLDQAKPPTELVVARVTKGKGVMPAFGSLSAQQVADVAAFVTKSTSG